MRASNLNFAHLLKAPAPSRSKNRPKPLLDLPDTCGNPDL
jgi:hypothetical protein